MPSGNEAKNEKKKAKHTQDQNTVVTIEKFHTKSLPKEIRQQKQKGKENVIV